MYYRLEINITCTSLRFAFQFLNEFLAFTEDDLKHNQSYINPTIITQ